MFWMTSILNGYMLEVLVDAISHSTCKSLAFIFKLKKNLLRTSSSPFPSISQYPHLSLFPSLHNFMSAGTSTISVALVMERQCQKKKEKRKKKKEKEEETVDGEA